MNQSWGSHGERMAQAYLQGSGYRILNRNFRVDNAEIDIVAGFNNELVLIEVKARRENAFADIDSVVSDSQLSRLILAGSIMLDFRTEYKAFRLDLILISKNRTSISLQHFRGVTG
jgi:putative endonuclease